MATLAEDALERGATPAAAVRRTAKRYGSATGGRVVVVDAAGRSVLDTQAPTPRQFASRPEIRAALAGAVATGRRHSATAGGDLLYVAVPVASGGVVHGVVRITYPMAAVDRSGSGGTASSSSPSPGSSSSPLPPRRRALARWTVGPLAALETRGGPPRRPASSKRDRPSRARPRSAGSRRPSTRWPPKLDSLVRSQDAFVADASHQLRTPARGTAAATRESRAPTCRPGCPFRDRGCAPGGRAAVRARRRPSRARPVRPGDRRAPSRSTSMPSPRSASRRGSALADERGVALVAEGGGPALVEVGPGQHRAGARQPRSRTPSTSRRPVRRSG